MRALLIPAPLSQRASPYCQFRFVHELPIQLCPFPINRAAVIVDCELCCVFAFAGLVAKNLNVIANALHGTTYVWLWEISIESRHPIVLERHSNERRMSIQPHNQSMS
jgi:hypothetical protein